jgi:hypothetical protein
MTTEPGGSIRRSVGETGRPGAGRVVGIQSTVEWNLGNDRVTRGDGGAAREARTSDDIQT